jgi:cyclophilin family peptidyl-prolyl cis-trans isomerase
MIAVLLWAGAAPLAGQSVPPAAPGRAAAGAARPQADALVRDYVSASISTPPSSFGWDTTFYRKYVDALGIPIISSARVPDEAVLVARDIVIHMTAKRPDVRAAMIERGTRVGVMAITEMTTDIPEQRDWKKPAIDDRRLTPGERARYNEPGGIGSMTDQEYWNRRARGMGGRYTTGAEENILGYPGTRYYGENILVHEFSHGIMGALRTADSALYARLEVAYQQARDRKLYLSPRGSPHYAVNTIGEYWAEGTQWWFWSNYPATFASHGVEQEVWSPRDLERYDPELYDILSSVYPDHHIPLDVYHGRRLRPRDIENAPVADTVRLDLLRQPEHPRWQEQAPARYHAEFETTRGRFILEVHRDWSPHGADRFYNLVRNGYYDGGRFHRVLAGYIVQWGVHGSPAVNSIWKTRFIPDDSVVQSNTRGFIGYAMTGPNLRATQVYINTADNSRNDAQGFSPFGRVIDGMDVVDSLYSGYGRDSGDGLRAGTQGPLEEGGNAYLAREYPELDYIIRARIRP